MAADVSRRTSSNFIGKDLARTDPPWISQRTGVSTPESCGQESCRPEACASISQRAPAIFDSINAYALCPVLSQCSAAFRRTLLQLGGEKARQGILYDRGQIVVEQGDVCNSVFIVYRGSLEVLQQARGLADTVIGLEVVETLQKGDTFGVKVFNGLLSHHNGTVRTTTICHLFEVTAAVIMKALVHHPADRRHFLHERIPEEKLPPPPVSTGVDVMKAHRQLCCRWKLKVERLRGAGAIPVLSDPSEQGPHGRSRERKRRSSDGDAMRKVHEVVGVVPSDSSADKFEDAPPTWWKNINTKAITTPLAEEERIIERLQASLMLDANEGYMLTGDVIKALPVDLQASLQEHPRRSVAVAPERRRGCIIDIDVPDPKNDGEEACLGPDLALLPPIAALTPGQKREVQENLQVRVLSRKRFRLVNHLSMWARRNRKYSAQF